MTMREAKSILGEMNLWMRGEGPYSMASPDTFRGKPYTNEEFCSAIVTAVEAIDMLLEGDFDRITNN